MTNLSPAAQAIWDAFNEDEAGVFVDYGEKLAAALRAAADQVVPAGALHLASRGTRHWHRAIRDSEIRLSLLAIAAELEGTDG